MIILDMDGVLAEFDKAACRANGLSDNITPTYWDWYEEHGLSAEEFWANIHFLGESFYADWVKPYPWCDEVVELVRQADEFVIMSSPSNDPAGYSGKKIWLDKYVPGLDPKQIIVGSRKELLAGPGRLLIDDGMHNIEAFRIAGGTALVFPQPWNIGHNHCHERIGFVSNFLETWKEEVINNVQ